MENGRSAEKTEKQEKLHQANAKDHGAISCHLFFVLINDKFKCKFKMTLTTSKSKTTLYFDHIGYTVWDSYISFILCYAPEDASLFQARWYGRGEGSLRERGGGLLNMAKRPTRMQNTGKAQVHEGGGHASENQQQIPTSRT